MIRAVVAGSSATSSSSAAIAPSRSPAALRWSTRAARAVKVRDDPGRVPQLGSQQFFQRRDRTCPITSRPPLLGQGGAGGQGGVEVVGAVYSQHVSHQLLPAPRSHFPDHQLPLASSRFCFGRTRCRGGRGRVLATSQPPVASSAAIAPAQSPAAPRWSAKGRIGLRDHRGRVLAAGHPPVLPAPRSHLPDHQPPSTNPAGIDEGKDGVRVVRAEVAFDFEGELLPIGGCGNEKPVLLRLRPASNSTEYAPSDHSCGPA